MKWIKWYGQQWLNSTARYELNAAERGLFVDFCSLSSLETIGLQEGQFKIASWQALAHKLNAPLEDVISARDKCLQSRISAQEIPGEGIIITILNWQKYQPLKSPPTPPLEERRGDKRRLDKTRETAKTASGNRASTLKTASTTTTTNEFEENPILKELVKGVEEGLGQMLTPLLGEELAAYSLEYKGPLEWIAEAFKAAVSNNVRRWSYVRAILDRWQATGKSDSRTGTMGNNGSGPSGDFARVGMFSPEAQKLVRDKQTQGG